MQSIIHDQTFKTSLGGKLDICGVFFFFLSRAETSALSRCQYLITSNEPKIHIVWYVTCNLNMWVITVSSLGCLRCWRMAGQDGSGASGERGREGERERPCSGNQDSFYTKVLISPQDTSSLRVECVRACVRSMWWLFTCPLVFKSSSVCVKAFILCHVFNEQVVKGVCVWVVKADGRGPHAATPPSDANTVTWRWQSAREVEGTVFSRCLAATGSDFLLPSRAQ